MNTFFYLYHRNCGLLLDILSRSSGAGNSRIAAVGGNHKSRDVATHSGFSRPLGCSPRQGPRDTLPRSGKCQSGSHTSHGYCGSRGKYVTYPCLAALYIHSAISIAQNGNRDNKAICRRHKSLCSFTIAYFALKVKQVYEGGLP